MNRVINKGGRGHLHLQDLPGIKKLLSKLLYVMRYKLITCHLRLDVVGSIRIQKKTRACLEQDTEAIKSQPVDRNSC